HTRSKRDWSSDVCSSDLTLPCLVAAVFTVRVAVLLSIRSVVGISSQSSKKKRLDTTKEEGDMAAWVIRAGVNGENEDCNLTEGQAGAGFREVDDLSHCMTRDDVRAVVEAAYPDAPKGRSANFTGQLWALRHTVQVGDLIILPLKRSGQLALGTCTKTYAYDKTQPDKERRHY